MTILGQKADFQIFQIYIFCQNEKKHWHNIIKLKHNNLLHNEIKLPHNEIKLPHNEIKL